MSRRKALPPPPAGVDPATRQWMEAVREQLEVSQGVRGSRLDQAITFGDTIGGNLPKFRSATKALTSTTDTSDLANPPAPDGVSGVPGIGSNTIIFQIPSYKNHGFTEVWRAEGEGALLGASVRIGIANGTFYSDLTAVEDVVYVYWARFVSSNDIAGPFSDSIGVELRTQASAATTLAAIEGKINSVLRSTLDIEGDNGLITFGTNFVDIDVGALVDGSKIVVSYGLSIGPFQDLEDAKFDSATDIATVRLERRRRFASGGYADSGNWEVAGAVRIPANVSYSSAAIRGLDGSYPGVFIQTHSDIYDLYEYRLGYPSQGWNFRFYDGFVVVQAGIM